MDEFEGLVENSVLESELMEKELEEKEIPRQRWERVVPVTTAFLAAFATIAALLATFSADKELEDRINRVVENVGRNHAITQREILRNREENMKLLGQILTVEDQNNLRNLERIAQEDLKLENELEEKSSLFNHAHHILALGITLFQVSIAISATALISRRKYLWGVSLVMLSAGLIVTCYGAVFYWGLN